MKVSVPDLDDCRLILRPTLLHNAIQLPRMHRILEVLRCVGFFYRTTTTAGPGAAGGGRIPTHVHDLTFGSRPSTHHGKLSTGAWSSEFRRRPHVDPSTKACNTS